MIGVLKKKKKSSLWLILKRQLFKNNKAYSDHVSIYSNLLKLLVGLGIYFIRNNSMYICSVFKADAISEPDQK